MITALQKQSEIPVGVGAPRRRDSHKYQMNRACEALLQNRSPDEAQRNPGKSRSPDDAQRNPGKRIHRPTITSSIAEQTTNCQPGDPGLPLIKYP